MFSQKETSLWLCLALRLIIIHPVLPQGDTGAPSRFLTTGHFSMSSLSLPPLSLSPPPFLLKSNSVFVSTVQDLHLYLYSATSIITYRSIFSLTLQREMHVIIMNMLHYCMTVSYQTRLLASTPQNGWGTNKWLVATSSHARNWGEGSTIIPHPCLSLSL